MFEVNKVTTIPILLKAGRRGRGWGETGFERLLSNVPTTKGET